MIRYAIPVSVFFLLALYFIFSKFDNNEIDNDKKNNRYAIEEDGKLIGFNLLDPETAPNDIRESVLRGYHVLMNTPFNAAEYSKDLLSCGSCHFCEGNSLGGRDNGISLLGVTQIYPQYSKRSQKTIDLAERINNCFERSMNGKALPLDSQIMHDILTYLDWISSEVKEIKNPPWLGLKMLKSKHTPNSENGALIYEKNCSVCHHEKGEGGGDLPEPVGKTIPPLWGENSFNDGAGMSMQPMLSAFIYWNMPYQNSILTEEEAIDVAAFVLKQPRPHFVSKQ